MITIADLIEFKTEGLEYTIQITKKLKQIYYSNLGKYIINIDFKNNINQVVLRITTTEKEYFSFIQSLNTFLNNLGSEYGNIMYLTNYFITVDQIIPNVYPDDEEERLQMNFFETSQMGNKLRLSLNMTYFYLEELIYQMFLIVEDLDNLDDLNYSDLLDYMINYESSKPC